MLRMLIILHVAAFLAALMLGLYVTGAVGYVLIVAGVAAVIGISGGLAAYFHYRRGKIYEKRGKSGPDD